MSSDSQTAETSNASAPAPETSQSENEPPAQNEAPEPASLPEKPEENPPADCSAPLNENPTPPALTAMTAIKQYPKMNVSKQFSRFTQRVLTVVCKRSLAATQRVRDLRIGYHGPERGTELGFGSNVE